MLGRGRGDRPRFRTDDVEIGAGVEFGRNVHFRSSRVRIGDGAIFGDNVLVDADSFEMGDFGTVYTDCFFPGPGSLTFGHNVWLGRGVIVDAMGGATLGDNVCAAAYSQLWTHMVFGDVLAGCRFHNVKSLTVGDDVWFGPGCLVSPITAGDRSLALMGSVVTSDMEADRCYAGSPAHDVTDKIGPQFEPRPVEEREAMLAERIAEFAREEGCQVAEVDTVFDVAARTYRKTGSERERRLIRRLLPEAKFIPEA